MNFSRIAHQLNEQNPSLTATADSAERSKIGGQNQHDKTRKSRQDQKQQMSMSNPLPQKSGVTYASKEARKSREMHKMYESWKSDWRSEIKEEEGDHPYVDVMPSINQKSMIFYKDSMLFDVSTLKFV